MASGGASDGFPGAGSERFVSFLGSELVCRGEAVKAEGGVRLNRRDDVEGGKYSCVPHLRDIVEDAMDAISNCTGMPLAEVGVGPFLERPLLVGAEHGEEAFYPRNSLVRQFAERRVFENSMDV